MSGIEPLTSPLPRECTTPELHGQIPYMDPYTDNRCTDNRCLTGQTNLLLKPQQLHSGTLPKHSAKAVAAMESGAGDGNRTHVISLEGWSTTTVRHPLCNQLTSKLATGTRDFNPGDPKNRHASAGWWREEDSNLRSICSRFTVCPL